MDTFEKALKFTLQWEGGYVNNPNDSGGATNKGITQKTYNQFIETHGTHNIHASTDVKNISAFEVSWIYKELYWNKIGADILDPKLAIAAFDFAVNSGVTTAKGLLAKHPDVKSYVDAREEFLKRIGVGKNSVFLKGWLNRVNALRKYLQEEA